jgi:hypothetical protein
VTAYISSLNRGLAAAATSATKPDLHQRLLDWYGSLPEVTRNRPFAMSEIENALGTQGKYLSSILLQLGWRRRRKWSSTGQYNRYWLPPHMACPIMGEG